MSSAHADDLSTGQTIAMQGTAKGVAACISCHGAKGEGNAAAGFPRLAGVSAPYLSAQLTAFADGTRQNPIMQPMAKLLSAHERDAVAQYFAGLLSHFTDGVFFALLFALLFHPFIPVRNTILGNLLKAFLYGTVLAVISAAWWVPAVYVPHHAGFLSTSLGWKLTFGIFLWHWIYGYFLGTVYCPNPKDAPVSGGA